MRCRTRMLICFWLSCVVFMSSACKNVTNLRQCPLLAPLVHIFKWFEDVCVRVLVYGAGIVRNELICGYANVLHTSVIPSTHTHTHIHTHTHTHAHTHARTHTHIFSYHLRTVNRWGQNRTLPTCTLTARYCDGW